MATLSKTLSIKSDGSISTQVPPTQGEYVRLDENLIVPSTGKFVQLKHWDELDKGDNDDPFPEMFNPGCGLITKDPTGEVYDYVSLPDEWQWFLWNFWKWASQNRLPDGRIEEFYKRPGNFRTFARATPGSLTYVYVDMVEAHRAFTEAGSPEAGNRDVVTKRNMTAKKNYEWLYNPTGGAMVKVLRTIGSEYEIEALNTLLPPPPVEEIISKPWLYFWCTQWDKFKGATRFPQIKEANEVHGLPPAGTPSPLLSLGGRIRIKKSSCDPLINGQSWSPYRGI